MPPPLTRRDFLTIVTGAAAIGIAGCGDSSDDCADRADAVDACGLPEPSQAPFDTVVVLMMENRSFDHLLGWLPGADGRQAGLVYRDTSGAMHPTHPLAPDWQGCAWEDPDHTWPGIAKQWNGGACDGFLQTAKVGDRFPIGYYVQADLPVLGVLAPSYTTFDRYFCSMMGPTWENRLYQLTGTTQVDMPDGFPQTDAARPCLIETAIFDRVREAGLSTGYYYHGEPMTGLFRSKKYDDISFHVEQFFADARSGRLPNVVFVDPDYTDAAEDLGTSNDYHHRGSILAGEELVGRVYDALKDGPQWDRMVFVLNFDEHGGFYDHVPPPECRDDTVPTADPFPNLKRLGFRVPAIAMGPFAPKKIEKAGPYEHCSILKMIEWRWELEPLTVRDRTAKNLAEALDFRNRREAVELPPYTAPPPLLCGA